MAGSGSIFQLDVKSGDTIQVRRVSTSSLRAQALKVGADKGELRANGVLTPVAAIWTHTAPKVATLEVVGRKTRTLELWNSWSYDGVDSSWIGGAGMRVESDGNAHTLLCSDGVGEPNFEDLVVEVTVLRDD